MHGPIIQDAIPDQTRKAVGDPANVSAEYQDTREISCRSCGNDTPVKRQQEQDASDLATRDGESECEFNSRSTQFILT